MIYILLLILIIVIIIFCGLNGNTKLVEVTGSKEKVTGSEEKERSLYTGETWFDVIQKGTKTIDVRPRSIEIYKPLEGKIVKYFHGDKSIQVKVVKVIHYDSIADLVDKEDWKKIGPQYKTKEEFLTALNVYFTEEAIKNIGGINAIYLDLNIKGAQVATYESKPKNKPGKIKTSKKGKKERLDKRKKKHGGDEWFAQDLITGTTGDESEN